jgi:CRISPR system Cascade subunit CasE
MTFITRANLQRGDSRQRALAQHLLGADDAAAQHSLLWTLFAEDPAAVRDFLYRQIAAASFLIVSNRPPFDRSGLWTLETKPYAPQFTIGDRLAFSLRASPSRSLRTPGAGRGRRIDPFAGLDADATPSRRNALALEWLFARATRLGGEVDRMKCRAERLHHLRIPRPAAAPIQVPVVDYSGVLEVTDPDALTQAVRAGVGRAKAFGCGLLLVRPEPSGPA